MLDSLISRLQVAHALSFPRTCAFRLSTFSPCVVFSDTRSFFLPHSLSNSWLIVSLSFSFSFSISFSVSSCSCLHASSSFSHPPSHSVPLFPLFAPSSLYPVFWLSLCSAPSLPSLGFLPSLSLSCLLLLPPSLSLAHSSAFAPTLALNLALSRFAFALVLFLSLVANSLASAQNRLHLLSSARPQEHIRNNVCVVNILVLLTTNT